MSGPENNNPALYSNAQQGLFGPQATLVAQYAASAGDANPMVVRCNADGYLLVTFTGV